MKLNGRMWAVAPAAPPRDTKIKVAFGHAPYVLVTFPWHLLLNLNEDTSRRHHVPGNMSTSCLWNHLGFCSSTMFSGERWRLAVVTPQHMNPFHACLHSSLAAADPGATWPPCHNPLHFPSCSCNKGHHVPPSKKATWLAWWGPVGCELGHAGSCVTVSADGVLETRIRGDLSGHDKYMLIPVPKLGLLPI